MKVPGRMARTFIVAMPLRWFSDEVSATGAGTARFAGEILAWDMPIHDE